MPAVHSLRIALTSPGAVTQQTAWGEGRFRAGGATGAGGGVQVILQPQEGLAVGSGWAGLPDKLPRQHLPGGLEDPPTNLLGPMGSSVLHFRSQ